MLARVRNWSPSEPGRVHIPAPDIAVQDGGDLLVEKKIGALLAEKGLTLATAESCTGGLVGHRITNVPGSSVYYLGGFVTYANRVKEELLGVRHETLLAYGTVSKETAPEMAQGARQQLGASSGLSVTGIAGPGGGTAEKPLGLVYIGLSADDAERCERYVWQDDSGQRGDRGNRDEGDYSDRLDNKEKSAEAALQLLLAYLKEQAVLEKQGTGMIEFVNEPVSVEVQSRPDGTVRPMAFVWRGRRIQLTAWGREQTKEQGEQTVKSYLVQSDGANTWELCQDIETAQWTLARHWAPKLRTA